MRIMLKLNEFPLKFTFNLLLDKLNSNKLYF